jgi:hypothetical protein
VFNAIFNNISLISRHSVLLVEKYGVPGENHQHVSDKIYHIMLHELGCFWMLLVIWNYHFNDWIRPLQVIQVVKHVCIWLFSIPPRDIWFIKHDFFSISAEICWNRPCGLHCLWSRPRKQKQPSSTIKLNGHCHTGRVRQVTTYSISVDLDWLRVYGV